MGVGVSVSVETKLLGDSAWAVNCLVEAEEGAAGVWTTGGELGRDRAGNVVPTWLQPIAVVNSSASDNQRAGAESTN